MFPLLHSYTGEHPTVRNIRLQVAVCDRADDDLPLISEVHTKSKKKPTAKEQTPERVLAQKTQFKEL